MCLRIDKSIKEKKPNKDGFCTGWKIIKEDNLPMIHGNSPYTEGLNTSNRGEYDFLKADEESEGVIDYGFHLFLYKKGASRLIRFRKNNYSSILEEKLIKVFYRPEDVISYGTLQYTLEGSPINGIPNVVVDKLTIKSLKGVSP